jgi:hypothetical protein
VRGRATEKRAPSARKSAHQAHAKADLNTCIATQRWEGNSSNLRTHARTHGLTHSLTAGRTGRVAAAVKDDAKKSAICAPRRASTQTTAQSVTATVSHASRVPPTAVQGKSSMLRMEKCIRQSEGTQDTNKHASARMITQDGGPQHADAERTLRANKCNDCGRYAQTRATWMRPYRSQQTHTRDHSAAEPGARCIVQVSASSAVLRLPAAFKPLYGHLPPRLQGVFLTVLAVLVLKKLIKVIRRSPPHSW